MKRFLSKAVAVITTLTMVLSVGAVARPASAAELLKVPTVDTANVGYNITRTMELLESSTAEHPNTVKIAFYGQSLIDPNNAWPKMLTDYLQEKYPTANVIMDNLAVGGFTAAYLKKMVRDDMGVSYPDLVVYMDYGEYQDYSEVLRYIRANTVSEFMFIDDHFTGGTVDPSDLPKPPINVSTTIPNLCKEFNCELVDARQYFVQYCADNKVSSSTYLMPDNTHMNDLGQELIFNIVKQYFVYRKPDEANAFKNNTVKRLEVGKDVKWNGDELVIEEEGSRYEAVFAGDSKNAANVTVNGSKPSDMLELYAHSRIYGPGGYWDIGGFLDASINKIPLEQDWKITLTSVDSNTGAYTYELTGSLTGEDGIGDSSGVFVSKSGIISIDPQVLFSFSCKPRI